MQGHIISRGTHNVLYRAIPILTVILGCETRALKEEENRLLEVFHHGAIISILGIRRHSVCDEGITNLEARRRFLNTTTLMNLL
jgi:hypothetical protein